MEWTVNDIFEEEVTKITSSLLPSKFNGDVRATRAVQEKVAKIVDDLGEASAAAQGLNKPITSAEKLRNNPTHVLYLLKDVRGNDGKGEIIGVVKVGRKHLFLFDEQEQVHEVEPLCVLDFYIVRERQRMGFGRRIYDYMLHDLETMAWEMAIDGPSTKMEAFMSRNFGIDYLMRQSNNFAVSPHFFDRSDEEISNSAGRISSAVFAAVGRFAAPKPPSAIADVIHGAAQDDASRRSPTPEGVGAAAEQGAEPGAGPSRRTFDNYYDVAEWDDDWEEPSDPELEDHAYEQFDIDQPSFERRHEMRARGAYRHDPAPVRYSPAPVRYNSPTPVRYSPPPVRYSPPVHERAGTLGVHDEDEENAPPAGAAPANNPAAAPANNPAAGMPSGAQSAAGTPSGRRDSQLTERGYFDVKYYHNKLW